MVQFTKEISFSLNLGGWAFPSTRSATIHVTVALDIDSRVTQSEIEACLRRVAINYQASHLPEPALFIRPVWDGLRARFSGVSRVTLHQNGITYTAAD